MMERYGKTSERRIRLEQMRETALELEQKIFRRIEPTADDLQAFNSLPPFELETLPPQLAHGLQHLSRETM